jgi:hypothetical protein
VKTPTSDATLGNKVKAFRNGERNFNAQDLNDIKIYLLKYKEQLQDTKFFCGKIIEFNVVSCFAETMKEELLEHMLKKFQCSIAIVVSLEDKSVYLKSCKEKCTVNLCKLAIKLCDSDCSEADVDIIKGKITEKFLKFTTTLKPCI